MKVRPYDQRDAAPLADLYVRSVEALGPQEYSERQVDAWAALAPSAAHLDALMADGRARFVAVDCADRPIAFADLEPDGHIHFLYCAPEAAGTGAASAVYAALETAARGDGMGRLYAEASEGARRFFIGKGFAVTSKREFEISGVAIHNYAVEKPLAAG